MKTFLIFLIFVTVVCDPFPTHAQWIQSGPSYGQINSIAVKGSYLFVSTGDRGIFVSSNNGSTWKSANTGLTVYNVSSLEVSGSTVYAGTSVGLFRSEDNANTWNAVNMGLVMPNIYTIKANGPFIYVATSYKNGGVFRSWDNGQSWNFPVANNGMAANIVAQSFAISDTILFAGTSQGAIYRSTDNGITWPIIGSGLSGRQINSLIVCGANIFAGTNGDGVFRSSDNGSNWSPVNTGLPANTIVSAFAVSDNKIFVGTYDAGVFLSTDMGGSWVSINNGLPINDQTSLSQIGALAINGGILSAGTTTDGLFQSSNYGINWTPASNGLANSGITSISVNGPNIYVASGGIYQSSDNCASWKLLYINSLSYTDPASVVATIGNTILAGSSSHGVYRSANNGTNWTAANSGLPANFDVNTFFVGGSNIFCGGYGGAFISANNGVSWSAINNNLTWPNVTAFAAIGSTMFAGTLGGGVFRSTDNGKNWTPVYNGMPGKYNEHYILSLCSVGSTLFAGTNATGGGIYQSTDLGATWHLATAGLPAKIGVPSFAVSGNKVFAGTDAGVFVSKDNGTSWVSINSNLPILEIRSLGASSSDIIAGSIGGGVWRRTLLEIGNPLVSLSRSFIDQGTIRLGQIKHDTFTIRNTGSDALHITSIISTIPAWRVSQTAMVIPSNQSALDTVTFIPSEFGIQSGKIVITSDSPTSPDTITVNGNSSIPVLTSLQSFIGFGALAKNLTRTETIKIVSSSINTLNIDSIYSSTTMFTTDKLRGVVDTDTLTLNITFSPTTYGSFVDTLYLKNNSSTPLVKIPMAGISPYPTIIANRPSIDWLMMVKGAILKKELQITNDEINTLLVDSIYTQTKQFTVDKIIGGSLAKGDTLILTLSLKPDTFAVFMDTLFIRNNSTTPLIQVPLRGESPLPFISIVPGTYRRDTVAIGDSSVQSFRIKNNSINDLAYEGLGMKTTSFVVSGSPSGMVKSRDSTSFSIVFRPSQFAFFEDTLSVASTSGTKKIYVSGFSPYPIMKVSQTSINFGDILRDSTGRKIFVIKNASINKLRVDSIKTGSKQFMVSAFTPPITISQKDSAVFSVSFKPDTVRVFGDTLRIFSNQLQSIMKIPLVGSRLTSVAFAQTGMPTIYGLLQNFPNPFNPSTTLSYGLPENSRVNLSIYNVLGQQIAVLVNKGQVAGTYHVIWNAEVASGMYFYRMEAVTEGNPSNRFVDVKKMILVR